MNKLKNIVIYPRGFLGYDIGLPVKKEKSDITQLMASVRFYKSNLPKDRTVISNDEVNDLFSRIFKATPGTKTMEFRERILKAALTAFGTTDFLDWCELQAGNPYFTSLHKRFMNDTFKFINTGEREINIYTWDRLISPGIAAQKDVNTPYEYRQYFKMDQASLFRKPSTVQGTIQSWVSQPGGFEDMIQSLRIMFCDHEG